MTARPPQKMGATSNRHVNSLEDYKGGRDINMTTNQAFQSRQAAMDSFGSQLCLFPGNRVAQT